MPCQLATAIFRPPHTRLGCASHEPLMPCGRQLAVSQSSSAGSQQNPVGLRVELIPVEWHSPQVGWKSCVPSIAAPSDDGLVTFPLDSMRETMLPYRWKLSEGSSMNDE